MSKLFIRSTCRFLPGLVGANAVVGYLAIDTRQDVTAEVMNEFVEADAICDLDPGSGIIAFWRSSEQAIQATAALQSRLREKYPALAASLLIDHLGGADNQTRIARMIHSMARVARTMSLNALGLEVLLSESIQGELAQEVLSLRMEVAGNRVVHRYLGKINAQADHDEKADKVFLEPEISREYTPVAEQQYLDGDLVICARYVLKPAPGRSGMREFCLLSVA